MDDIGAVENNVHVGKEKTSASPLRKPTPHRLNVLHLMRAKYIHVRNYGNCVTARS